MLMNMSLWKRGAGILVTDPMLNKLPALPHIHTILAGCVSHNNVNAAMQQNDQ